MQNRTQMKSHGAGENAIRRRDSSSRWFLVAKVFADERITIYMRELNEYIFSKIAKMERF